MTSTVFTINASAQNLQLNSKLAQAERIALESADYLIKNCAGEGGIAKCDDKKIYSHELAPNAAEALSEAIKKLEAKTGAHISAQIDGAGEGICIKRIVLQGEKESIVIVCVEP